VNFEETIKYMFSKLPMYQRIGKAAYKADMKTSIDFDNYLNNPHRSYKTVHIAGTNGKGSVSHMLASVLQEAGYKVGLYTSPHLKCFTERIRINGEDIEKQYVADFIENHKNFIETKSPSFFEITVFMAFQYFKDKNIDIAIVETGMGGRLDSTNVIYPELSVITNISLDHTTFLGDSIAAIANEKAGIIKENVPVVIGETNNESKVVFEEKAKEKSAEIFFADKHLFVDYSTISPDLKQVFNIKNENSEIVYKNLICDLLGKYQQKNIVTALFSLEKLKDKFSISNENIYKGIANIKQNTNLLGRWQVLSVNPLVVCDTGHNEAGIKEIVSQIKMTAYKKLHIVFGTVNDKNIDNILSLLPKDAYYYFTQAKIPRALDCNELSKKANSAGLHGEVIPDVKTAYNTAIRNAGKHDFVFVGGSTFVVAEVL